MYQGKEICQGCKVSGVDKSRTEKNNLCKSCSNALQLGLKNEFINNMEYVRVKDWHNGYTYVEQDDRNLDNLSNKLLKALHNPFVEMGGFISFPRSQGYGADFYSIPAKVAECLKEYFEKLNIQVKNIRKIKEETDFNAKQAVSNEGTKIYNEGIEKGRNLLLQLNSGEITTTDFLKKFEYQ